jgi:haloalkane dehalogenase
MAYIDENAGEVYQKMAPILLNHTTSSQLLSRRVIAPDLFGFGRSDKPTRDSDSTFNFHRDALLNLVNELELTNDTLGVQDWGALLRLKLPIEDPSRFKRLIVMNTSLETSVKPTQGFLDWLANNRTPGMDIGSLMSRSCRHLSKAEIEAYNAPYPNKDCKGGVRRFPNLVMI